MGDAERRGHDLLAVPGQEVHAVADHPDHVRSGDVAVIDHALGDVHRLFRTFPVEEHRVVGRQPLGRRAGHDPSNLRAGQGRVGPSPALELGELGQVTAQELLVALDSCCRSMLVQPCLHGVFG